MNKTDSTTVPFMNAILKTIIKSRHNVYQSLKNLQLVQESQPIINFEEICCELINPDYLDFLFSNQPLLFIEFYLNINSNKVLIERWTVEWAADKFSKDFQIDEAKKVLTDLAISLPCGALTKSKNS